ncbi:MAG TPA: hypothetical protein PKW80_15330, partial [Bacteroidales bacterium]|nr:hypothetical protein [Bacteroidales bacterium]
ARQISANLSRKSRIVSQKSASWRMRWQENMRCAELAEARCQGVACAEPAWWQTGFDIYFLVRQLADWYFLFQDKKYNKRNNI